MQSWLLGAKLLSYVCRGILPASCDMQVLDTLYYERVQHGGGDVRMPVAEALIEGTVHAQERAERNEGVAALRNYYACLQAQGRQLMLATLLEGCPYDTVGYLLTLWLKEEILAALQAAPDAGLAENIGNAPRRWFLGSELHTLLGVLTRLPEGQGAARTAALVPFLLQRPDRLMATLNLTLFLMKYGAEDIERRVEKNETGVRRRSLLGCDCQRFLTLLWSRSPTVLILFRDRTDLDKRRARCARGTIFLAPVLSAEACCGGGRQPTRGRGRRRRRGPSAATASARRLQPMFYAVCAR